jgi:hypothetical protein
MLSFSKQLQKIAILFLFLWLVVSSCTPAKSKLAEYGPTFESVMLNDVGVFRGFNFGDSLLLIQSKESGKPIETDKDYLYYEYNLNSDGSFNIAYNFDELGLNEIHSDIFINNSDDAEETFNKFKTYLDRHYGVSQTQMGFNIWSVKSDKYGEVKINLSNESADFTVDRAPGKISLWIYPDKN